MTTSDEAITNPITRGEAVAEPIAPVEQNAKEKVRTRGGRYEFLDALRGVAALAVVIEHCSTLMWPSYEQFSKEYFGAGVFGVFVFFIVSGYIIPASLERGRALGAFWAGRFFRLFPLFWGCLIAALVLHFLGMYGGPPGWMASPAWNLLTNSTMAHWFLVGSNSQMLVVAWTLSYELVFYMFVSLLFIAGLNRRSVPSALLAISAIPLAGLFLPIQMINGADANLVTRLVVVVATVAVAAFFAYRAPTRSSAIAAVVLASLAIPLLLNQPGASGDSAIGPSGYSAAIFAAMFVGTVLYRMATGEISSRLGWVVFTLAVVVMVGFAIFQEPGLQSSTGVTVTWQREAFTLGGAYLLFAVALLLRRYSFPAALLFLGRISFSLYLVHGFVLNVVPKRTESLAGISAAWLTWIVWVAVSIGVATLTYYKVEKPFVEVGHRVIAKIEARSRPAVGAA